MHFTRYPVPTNKEIIIGHDYINVKDVLGFVEPSDTKWVKLDDKEYAYYEKESCKNCNLFFHYYEQKRKYEQTYKSLFLVHPDMCIDIINEIGLTNIFKCLRHSELIKNVWYVYAANGLLTAEYFVNGLIKWKIYEAFIDILVSVSVFGKIVDKACHYIYQQYDKCKGYTLEGLCKKDLAIFSGKKIHCDHNTLYFLQSLENEKDFYIYDAYCQAPLALPNIYDNASVCWGTSSNKPHTLTEAYTKWWSTPFNQDLLLSSNDTAYSMIEGYGFNADDFYSYDKEYDQIDYEAEPREFTTYEIVQIINDGGNNRVKGDLDLMHVTYNVEGVREVLVVDYGRNIPDFAEIIDEDFLSYLNYSDNLFIFLINELEKDVWQAYVPTDEDEGVYIQINLQDLANLNLDDDTDTEETEDDDNY